MTLPESTRIGDPTPETLDWYKRAGREPRQRLFVDVTLRRASDGHEIVIHDETGFEVDDEGPDEAIDCARFQWLDGNYGCDCNRHLFFERALGNDVDDADCGHTRYRIVAPEWLADGDERFVGSGTSTDRDG